MKYGFGVVQGYLKQRGSTDHVRLSICPPSCTILELFDVEQYRDLTIWLRGHSRSFKLMPFERLGAVSYLLSIVTTAVPVAVCEQFSVKACGLGNWVRGR